MKISTILGVLTIFSITAISTAQQEQENVTSTEDLPIPTTQEPTMEDSKNGEKDNKSDIPGSLGRYFMYLNCNHCKIASKLVVQQGKKNKTSEDAENKMMKQYDQKDYENFDEDYTDNEYGDGDDEDEDNSPNVPPKPGNTPTKSPCSKKNDEDNEYSEYDPYDPYYAFGNNYEDNDKFSEEPEKPKTCPN